MSVSRLLLVQQPAWDFGDHFFRSSARVVSAMDEVVYFFIFPTARQHLKALTISKSIRAARSRLSLAHMMDNRAVGAQSSLKIPRQPARETLLVFIVLVFSPFVQTHGRNKIPEQTTHENTTPLVGGTFRILKIFSE